MKIRSMVLACSMAVTTCLFAGVTHYVVPSGTAGNEPAAPYESWATAANDLGVAMGAAAVGDEICVAPGTYSPTVCVTGKGVTIRKCDPLSGGDTAAEAVFDGTGCGSSGAYLTFPSSVSSAAVRGLTFRNFRATPILVDQASNVVIADSRFTGNSSSSAGGAICLSSAVACSVSKCSFTGNSTSLAGGAVSSVGSVRIMDCDFSNNTATSAGGDVDLSSGTVMADCRFTGTCSAEYGAAVRMNGPAGGNVLSNCTFTGISASGAGYGGFIWARGGEIVGCSITNNVSLGGKGVIMAQSLAADLSVRNCLIANNGNIKCDFDFYAAGKTYTVFVDNSTIYTPSLNLFTTSTSSAYSAAFLFRNSVLVGNGRDNGDYFAATYENCVRSDPGGFLCCSEGDFRLRDDSACIGAGEALPWHAGATDLRGAVRVTDGRIDIGCYQRQETDPQYSSELRVVSSESEKTGEWADAYVGVQPAITAARDNARVLIKAGTYTLTSSLSITDKDLCLQGEYADDPSRTVLDGQENVRILRASQTTRRVRLEGLSFVRGKTVTDDGQADAGNGGGLFLSMTDCLTPSRVVNCCFRSCSAKAGGAVSSSGSVRITGCDFADNTAVSAGGDADIASGTVVAGCCFTGTCSAEYGAAVRMNGPAGGNVLSNCTFTGISASGAGYGGFIWARGGEIVGCSITNNVSLGGKGVIMAQSLAADLSVRNCLIANNGTIKCDFDFYAAGKTYTVSVDNCTIYTPSLNLFTTSTSSAYSAAFLIRNSVLVGNGRDNGDYFAATYENCVQADPGGFVCCSEGDFRLRDDSPCFGAGKALPWHAGATDLRGAARVTDGRIDIGCYQRQETDPQYSSELRVVSSESEKTGEWADAYVGIESAVAAARDNSLVLVRSGVYRPLQTLVVNREMTLRSARADGAEGVDTAGTVLDVQGVRRILFAKATTLDGTTGNATSQRRIVIDGFTFKNGKTLYGDGQQEAGYGGGLYLVGRAACAEAKPSEVVNCRFVNCEGTYGGGVSTVGGIYRNCWFEGNVATNEWTEVSDTTTRYRGGVGGGMAIPASCVLSDTSADYTEACLWHATGLFGCTFTNNVAETDGGGVAANVREENCAYSIVYASECLFADNRTLTTRSDEGKGNALYGISRSLVKDCVFRGNVGGAYGAVFCSDKCRLADCSVTDGNRAYWGALVALQGVELDRCQVARNEVSGFFGWLSARNCLFEGAANYYAVNLYGAGKLSSFENCTVVGPGLVIRKQVQSDSMSVRLVNTIIWRAGGEELFMGFDNLTLKAENSCFSMESSFFSNPSVTITRTDCKVADPVFKGRLVGNWRLRRGSPCRDTGKVITEWMDASTVDLDHNPRVVTDGVALAENPSALPDMGCFENQEEPRGLMLMVR